MVVYRLERSATGWGYRVLTPPAVPYERSVLLGIGGENNIDTTLWSMQAGPVVHKEDIELLSGDGQWRKVGPAEIPALNGEEIETSEELTLVGASSDLSSSFYSITNEPVSPRHSLDVWPGDTTRKEAKSLYEYRYQDTPDAEPKLVGVENSAVLNGSPYVNDGAELISSCGTDLGSAPGESAYNAVSEDGDTVFFTARECEGSPPVNEIYARLDGARTVAISEPSKEDCSACNTATELKSARFVGASADGKKAFFMTEQALQPGEEGMGLYAYDFAAPLASSGDPDGRISLVSPGSKPEIQGVVRISEDGSHVYFVGKGILAGPNAERQSPQVGADNLYVYEPDPTRAGVSDVRFIATLLTPAAEAEALERGETEILREDQAVWGSEDTRPAQATPNGRFLVFASSAELTADDSSHIPQIFEYDSQGGPSGEGGLTRISIGQGGSYDDNGNVDSFGEAPQIPRQSFSSSDLPSASRLGLAVSDDGSRVFFTSTAPLTPLAVSRAASLFEYRGGNVYLISDGKDRSIVAGEPAVQLYGTNPSGADVFFTTADELVPQAADTQQALYDAREEGGFPAPTLQSGCLGETCRGATSEMSWLAPAGTATQAPEAVASAASSSIKAKGGPPPVRRTLGSPHARAFAHALEACDRRPRRQRRSCRAGARQRYGRHQGGAA